jgi:esterase
VKLHTELVHAGDAVPNRWLLVLHGVFGSGKNWRLFMRGVAKQQPDWGFVLVDLRGHGRSPSGEPPHGLDAAADDLIRLESQLEQNICGVVGHSLGGKVALAFAERRSTPLEQTWVLDTQPGTQQHAGSPTTEVLELLEALPASFDTRSSFVAELQQRGLSRAIASWLAMSVRRDDGGRQRLRLDLAVIRSLLTDHYRRDMWEALSAHRSERLHLVVAANSFVWRAGDRERLAGVANARVRVHTLAEAGHWLHVDAPEALATLFTEQLDIVAVTRGRG